MKRGEQTYKFGDKKLVNKTNSEIWIKYAVRSPLSTINLRFVKCATFEAATGAPRDFSADKRHKNWQHACYHNRPNSIQCVADRESSKVKGTVFKHALSDNQWLDMARYTCPTIVHAKTKLSQDWFRVALLRNSSFRIEMPWGSAIAIHLLHVFVKLAWVHHKMVLVAFPCMLVKSILQLQRGQVQLMGGDPMIATNSLCEKWLRMRSEKPITSPKSTIRQGTQHWYTHLSSEMMEMQPCAFFTDVLRQLES